MKIIWSLALLLFSSLMSLQAGSLNATDLHCEYQSSPVAVDAAQPRLGWLVVSEARGVRQSAYRILAASNADLLAKDQADLWDSGKVASSAQNQVRYGGKALEPNEDVFWKVMIWGGDDIPSGWSQPARFRMGLMRASEWRAKWIAADPDAAVSFDDCRWVWFPEGNPAEEAPAGKRYFRKPVKLPADVKLVRAILLATADNHLVVRVNGAIAGDASAWERWHAFDITSLLAAGENAIGIEAENPIPSPAGLTGKVMLSMEDGREISLPVDASWKSSASEKKGWDTARFNDRDWLPSRELGPHGMAPWGRPVPPPAALPMFRREFVVARPLRRAVVHVCGLGHHDLFLNGQKVGDHFLDPAWTVFEKSLYYSSHDITARLKEGENAIGVMLGKGFYNTEGDRRVHGVHARRPLKLILQAHLQYEDGTEEVVISDGNWRSKSGPVTHSAILGGEDYDARAMPDGWCVAGYPNQGWRAAVETDGPGGELRAAYAPALKKFEIFNPIRIDEPENGIFVYDLGQNSSAIPRIRVRGKAGQKIRLSPAEQRHGSSDRRNDGRGLVNPAGVGTPNYWEYTLRGAGAEVWEPQFNYSGFQYIQVEGAVPQGHANPGNLPVIESLVAVHVRSSAESVGKFETSNPLINAIDRNIDWAVRSNLSHVLTDCPHREKLGWLEVAYLMGPSIAGRYDLSRLYAKVARDCMDSQTPDGRVPTVAPSYPDFGDNGFTYTPEWGAAAVIVPWQLYRWYGDTTVLASNFDSMRGYLHYMRDTATGLVPKAGLGDWYDYNKGGSNGPSQFTPPELSAMATFYRCAQVLSDAAAVLGKASERDEYGRLAGQIRTAFNERFFDGKGEYRNSGSPQTAHSMALVLGLVPEGFEQAVFERIIEDIRARENQQTAGDVGFPYLIEALVRFKRHDVLYDISTRNEMGSYGFIVNNGWTALPEAWDANTGASMNHCMLGHIQQWFLGSLAGIRPEPLEPGFARFTISPEPVGDLKSGLGEYQSIRGLIGSTWKIEGENFHLKVVIPPNTIAEVHLPAAGSEVVTESGRPVSECPSIRFLRQEGVKRVFEVGSGVYVFSVKGR